MPRYLVQASHSLEGMTALVANPMDRSEAIRRVVENLGGVLESFHYSFGEYDVVGIVEMPDNAAMAALSMAISAGGAVKALKTTPLLSVSEAMEAMAKAGSSAYRPPGE